MKQLLTLRHKVGLKHWACITLMCQWVRLIDGQHLGTLGNRVRCIANSYVKMESTLSYWVYPLKSICSPIAGTCTATRVRVEAYQKSNRVSRTRGNVRVNRFISRSVTDIMVDTDTVSNQAILKNRQRKSGHYHINKWYVGGVNGLVRPTAMIISCNLEDCHVILFQNSI